MTYILDTKMYVIWHTCLCELYMYTHSMIHIYIHIYIFIHISLIQNKTPFPPSLRFGIFAAKRGLEKWHANMHNTYILICTCDNPLGKKSPLFFFEWVSSFAAKRRREEWHVNRCFLLITSPSISIFRCAYVYIWVCFNICLLITSPVISRFRCVYMYVWVCFRITRVYIYICECVCIFMCACLHVHT